MWFLILICFFLYFVEKHTQKGNIIKAKKHIKKKISLINIKHQNVKCQTFTYKKNEDFTFNEIQFLNDKGDEIMNYNKVCLSFVLKVSWNAT